MHPDHWRLFRRIQILDLIPVRLVPDGHRQPFVYKGAATRFSINPSPTPYSALNTVLVYFVERVRDLTADNFVGAYLQGSFALGDFDENSDADFLIVVKRDIADSDVPALNALHAAIHDFPPPWGHRLEGSYSPAAILRRWSENPRDPPGAPPRPPTWADPGTSGSP